MDRPDDRPAIRRASPDEAEVAARVMIDSRRAAAPAIPPAVHPDDEVVTWFRDVVAPTRDVLVARLGPEVVAVMVLSPGWIDQLYVDPDHTGRGIGTALLDRAKAEATGPFDLWTFASNVGAQRFYERNGFVAIDRTEGDNEEGEPDIRYRWPGPDRPRGPLSR